MFDKEKCLKKIKSMSDEEIVYIFEKAMDDSGIEYEENGKGIVLKKNLKETFKPLVDRKGMRK